MQSPAVSKSFSSLDETRFVFSDESVTCPNKLHQHLSGGCVSSYSSSPAYWKKHHHHHHHHSPYDYTMKVILLGDQGVGKTSFMKALHVHPDVAKVPCRCGKGGDGGGGGGGGGRKQQGNVDHLELEITTQTGKTALVRLCDTGGQERYRSLTSSYYRGAHGVIIMFDLNHSKSLDNVEAWLSDLDSYLSTSSCTRVLLGSHCTSPNRVISGPDARKYAENRTMPYMDTDSSQFYNIVESIQLVVDRIATDIHVPSNSSTVIKPSFSSHSPPLNKKKFSCTC